MVISKGNRLETKMLGIDPGLQRTGWGIVLQSGSKFTHVAHGTIKTKTTWTSANRLDEIHSSLNEVIKNWLPNKAAVEQIFVAKGADSALKLGMARGVAMQTCAGKGLDLTEISARQVKKAVTGTGAADKTQVAAMVEKLLNIKPEGLDASDALAIAIAGINMWPNYSIDRTNLPTGNGLKSAIEAALLKEQRR
ncbi:MAG: crossover junction endodeoxyribonuclease RuvC [Alphaproteobacteria bacterium]|nr:MAG: crossover junction endodeoxyribonuclease RuvC [Alphaproteobacteria bacterium]